MLLTGWQAGWPADHVHVFFSLVTVHFILSTNFRTTTVRVCLSAPLSHFTCHICHWFLYLHQQLWGIWPDSRPAWLFWSPAIRAIQTPLTEQQRNLAWYVQLVRTLLWNLCLRYYTILQLFLLQHKQSFMLFLNTPYYTEHISSHHTALHHTTPHHTV